MNSTLSSQFVAHLLNSWRHHTSLLLATIVVFSASLGLIASMLVLSLNLKHVLTLWGDHIEMSVYLKSEAEPQAISEVENYLRKLSTVDKVQTIPREKALEQFKNQFSNYAADLVQDAAFVNLLPSSIHFMLSHTVAPHDQLPQLESLSKELKQFPAVEDVGYGQEWVKGYTAVTDFVHWLNVGLGMVIFLGGTFVISNSLQASISQRRDDISILELIGATTDFIRRPYQLEGALIAFVGSCISILVSFGLFAFARSYLEDQAMFSQIAAQLQFLTGIEIFGFVIVASMAGYIVATLHVRRINTGWLASTEGLNS